LTRNRLAVLALVLAAAQAESAPPPTKSGLTESTAVHLAQIEVSLAGPPDVIRRLVPEDFRIRVNHRDVEKLSPTAVAGIVCRGKKVLGRLQVERRLAGETKVEFPPLDIDMEKDRCAQIRDLIPARAMSSEPSRPGEFTYLMIVSRGGVELARGGRKFLAVSSP
jgi:hypothetical protein